MLCPPCRHGNAEPVQLHQLFGIGRQRADSLLGIQHQQQIPRGKCLNRLHTDRGSHLRRDRDLP